MPDEPFELARDRFGLLVLTDADGRRHVGVTPARAFPLTDPSRRIALCDESGREVAWIEDLAALPGPIRVILEEEFAAREFVPTILRIVKVSGDSAPSDWDVETDRGPTRFTLDSDEMIRKLGADRVLIADAIGLRYNIPSLKSLDAASRRMLERYL
jgi:hypothetical protein